MPVCAILRAQMRCFNHLRVYNRATQLTMRGDARRASDAMLIYYCCFRHHADSRIIAACRTPMFFFFCHV